MQKPRLFVWTDCYFFGGSENLLLTLLHSPELYEAFEVRARYRYSEAYRLGAAARGLCAPTIRPIWLPTLETLLDQFGRSRGLVGLARAKAAAAIHIAIRWSGLEAIYAFGRIGLEILRFRPAALIINNGGYPGALSCRVAAVAAAACGVPCIFVVNNIAFPPSGFIYRVLDNWVCRSVTQFVTASRAAAAALASRVNLADGAIESVPNCLPPDRFQVCARVTTPCRARHGNQPVRVLGVAHLEQRKGFHVLIEAIRLLAHEPGLSERVIVDIVGDGPAHAELARLIEHESLADIVRLHGAQLDIDRWLGAADIFCLPSVANEDMPYAIVEAMVAGKAVISTAVGGIPEILGFGRYGVVVPPGDALALAHEIRNLAERQEEREGLGMAARRHATEAHHPARSTLAYVKIVREACAKRECLKRA